MAQNLSGSSGSTSSYSHPVDIISSKGYYLHTVKSHYEDSPIKSEHLSSALNQQIGVLKKHIGLAQTVENQFYQTFGVSSAEEFSSTFLYGNFNPNQETTTVLQKILKILNNRTAVAHLTNVLKEDKENAKDARLRLYQESAKQVLLEIDDPQIVKSIQSGTSAQALNKLMDILNETKGKLRFVSGRKKQIQTSQKGKISSKTSSKIREVFLQRVKGFQTAERNQRNSLIKSKIQNYINYFETEARKMNLDEDLILQCSQKLKTAIENTVFKNDKDGQVIIKEGHMLTNFHGAGGGMMEIIFEQFLEFPDNIKNIESQFYTQNELLANEMVKGYKSQFENGQFKTVYTKKGTAYKVNVKSPVDMLLYKINKQTNKIEQTFSIQFKNNIQSLEKDIIPPLSLQHNISLPVFLGNTINVSSPYLNNLLIYHIVNQGQWGDVNSAGSDFIEQALNSFIELYTESIYAKVADGYLSGTISKNTAKLGNMFFIYGGRLIPMSYFLQAVIDFLEKPGTYGSALATSPSSLIQYNTKVNIPDDVNMPNTELELGYAIYSGAKVTEISVAMDKVISAVKQIIQQSA